jgi:hypothetical protein
MFLVICDHKDGPYIPEVSDLDHTRLVTVTKHILEGQYSNILAIIEINPIEHIARDATNDFREIIDRRPDDA